MSVEQRVKVMEIISDVRNKYVLEINDEITKRDMINELVSRIGNEVKREWKGHLNFDARVNGDTLEIVPKNLASGLALRGIDFLPKQIQEVENKEILYKRFAKFIFDHDTGKMKTETL